MTTQSGVFKEFSASRLFQGVPKEIFCKPNPLECSECHDTFSEKPLLHSHMKVHRGATAFTCSLCSKSFSYQFALNRHMLTHSNEHVCSVCKDSFPDESIKNKHMKSHAVKCGICKLSFINYNMFQEHITKVHRQLKGPVTDELSDDVNVFSIDNNADVLEKSQDYASNHSEGNSTKKKKNRTRVYRIKCEADSPVANGHYYDTDDSITEKNMDVFQSDNENVSDGFENKSVLSDAKRYKHSRKRRHSTEFRSNKVSQNKNRPHGNGYEIDSNAEDKRKSELKQYVCFMCDQKFIFQKSLEVHVKTHKLFACSSCPRFFNRALALKKHRKAHTVIYPYMCTICDTAFTDVVAFNKHEKIYAERHFCYMCGFACHSYNELESHKVTHLVSEEEAVYDVTKNEENNSRHPPRKSLDDKATLVVNQKSQHTLSMGIQSINENFTALQDIYIAIPTTQQMFSNETPFPTAPLISPEQTVMSESTNCSTENRSGIENVIINSVFSTHENLCDLLAQQLDTCQEPFLDLNSKQHITWLADFIEKSKSLKYPFSNELFKKLTYVLKSLSDSMSDPAGTLKMKENFAVLLNVYGELTKIISDYLKHLYKDLS